MNGVLGYRGIHFDGHFTHLDFVLFLPPNIAIFKVVNNLWNISFLKQKWKHFIHNLGFEESIEELVTTDAQLSIDLADQNVTLNSLSGELSTLNRFVSLLNDTVEQMTLSGNKK